MAVTARDVAREAGVSPATVSLVFRNKPGVGEQTRVRVREVAERLGFEYAGSTTPTKTRTLQLIMYKGHGKVVSQTPFFEDLTRGISEETYNQGYHRLAISYFYSHEHPSEQLQSLRSTKCAGIILLATEMGGRDVPQFLRLGVPVVLLDSWFPSQRLDSVIIDNQRGAWDAVRYLAKRGHTDIAHASASAHIRNFFERQDGYRQAMWQVVGRDFDDTYGTLEVGTDVPSAKADTLAWLDRLAAGQEYVTSYGREGLDHIPTAIFCDNDLMAAGVMAALEERGYQVPRDVSVVGFDNMPLCESVSPSLTTMAVPAERMGAVAVQRLANVIDGGDGTVLRVSVLPEIVERESVAAPRTWALEPRGA